jgi:hypothetical protein
MTRMAPLVLVLASTAVALPAQAGSLTRTFVSSAGSDSNPCTTAQPCASFTAAYAAVASGGIVAALDPGKYGPLTITGSVTINGNGWSAITAPTEGNGITINAGSGNVVLAGLEIDSLANVDGATTANGIVLNSAASLTVTNCILQNLGAGPVSGAPGGGYGILLQPTSGTLDFTITNTIVANNGVTGVLYQPPSGSPNANGVIDHLTANANVGDGIDISTGSASGGTTVISISNSIFSGSEDSGIHTNNVPSLAPIKLSIDNVTASGNGTNGIEVGGTTIVLLGRSIITGNSTGVNNHTSPSTAYTYGDNRINLNLLQDINGALNTTFPQQ